MAPANRPDGHGGTSGKRSTRPQGKREFHPPPPDFVPPTIAESLARGFDDETEFHVMNGKPIAL